MTDLLAYLGCLLLGVILGYVVGGKKKPAATGVDPEAHQAQLLALTEAKTQLNIVENDLNTNRKALSQRELQLHELEKAHAALQAQFEQINTQHKAWMETAQPQFEAFLHKTLAQVKEDFRQNAEKTYTDKQTAFDEKMKTLLKPLNDSIEAYQKQVNEMDKEHHTNNALLRSQINNLNNHTQNLYLALSHNKGRGDWGEIELIRLLEESGLNEGFGYEKQQTIGLESNKRPDIRINLPDGRVLFVDAKALQVDLDDVVKTTDASDSLEAQRAREKRYAQSLKDAIKNLGSKAYQDELGSSANFVVLYVPREAMVAYALAAEPRLFEDAFQKNIILAGPFNMMALLKIVHHSWALAKLSDEAHTIRKVAKDIHRQAALFAENLEKMGSALATLNNHYKKAIGSFQGNVGLVKQTKKLEALGVDSSKTLSEDTEFLDKIPSEVPEIQPVTPLGGE